MLCSVSLPKSLVTGRQLIKVGPSIELKGHCSYETLRLGLGSGLLSGEELLFSLFISLTLSG